MSGRSLTYFIGLITGIVASAAWRTPGRTMILAAAQRTAAQAHIPLKVKEDPAFKAEWEKVRNSDPKAFEKQKDQFTLMAQMDLAEMGYGTSFTANLDEGTKEALRAYQALRGLPETADVDPLTIDQLRADEGLLHREELFLSPFQFIAAGWDQGGFTSIGSWLEDGAAEPEVEESQLECDRDWKLCIDGQARLLKGFGGGINLVGKFEAYQIKQWDKYEIVAVSPYPSPCERDTLRINRQ
jgi:putative peptidoglycan binding protein